MFDKLVVMVTGASSGIGEALCDQLAAGGARLVLCARNKDALERVAESCRLKGADVLVVPTDVCVPDQCRAAVTEAIERFGALDVLINNAGVSMFARFTELEDLWPMRQTMEVNYFGAVYCTHYALPHLKKRGGRIVAVNSLTGLTGVPTRTGYAASKHAMRGFFDSLRIELATDGVTITSVYPGFVQTPVRERALGADGTAMGRDTHPDPKAMSAQQCARIILNATANRKRQVVMTAKGKLGPWLKLIAPGWLDRIARRTIENKASRK